ncbi:unnamed protein product [Polarella glacialis]|uniref:SET domain-containing protein n=1 Tax=Polarella glacialis TaxID=89957 RepID=A0A813KQP6_POLGL|nr:unnamed protein product [Polarella glacialis]
MPYHAAEIWCAARDRGGENGLCRSVIAGTPPDCGTWRSAPAPAALDATRRSERQASSRSRLRSGSLCSRIPAGIAAGCLFFSLVGHLAPNFLTRGSGCRAVGISSASRFHAERVVHLAAHSAAADSSRLAKEELSVDRASGAGLWPAMFEWVTGTGMDTSDIAVEVAPVDLAPGELGLIAKVPLEPGDVLVWAPTSLLLSKPQAVAVWGDLVGELSERIALALLLIHERFVRAEESTWSTYVRSLPRFDGDVSGPSFLWSDEELEELQGSDGYGAAVQMYNTILDDFVSLNATLFAGHPDQFGPSVFTLENFCWASAVVASRAYGDDNEGTFLCIAPLVDFLNHRAGALQLTRFGNGIVAYAHKHYEVGDQVWVSYGGKSNAELLSQYGFVDVDNAEEAVYLRVGEHLVLDEPFAEKKLQLLGELLGEGSDPRFGIFKLTRRPRDWEAQLLPALRTLALSLEELLGWKLLCLLSR